jgi:hypothetical protein
VPSVVCRRRSRCRREHHVLYSRGDGRCASGYFAARQGATSACASYNELKSRCLPTCASASRATRERGCQRQCGGAEVFVKRSKRQRTAPRQLKIGGVVHFQWNYSRSRREEPSFLVQRYEDFQTVDAIESRPPVSILVGCGAETMVDENNPLTPEQMAARIAELESRLAKSGTLSFKVSEKGAVSGLWFRAIPRDALFRAVDQAPFPYR